MKLYQLRYFMVLAHEGSFSLAAQKLHIAQPPLSHAIKELEGELGVQLLVRNTRNTRLTNAGNVFRSHASRILHALDAAKKATVAAGNGCYREIRVGIVDMIDNRRLSRLLTLLREDDPQLHIQLHEVCHAHLKAGLKEKYFDIGLTQLRLNEKGLFCKKIWSDPFAVLLSRTHPLLRFKKIPLAEVIRHPQVVLDQHKYEGYYQQVMKCLTSSGTMPNIAEYTSTMNTLLALVQAGFGISLANIRTCQRLSGKSIAYRPIEGAKRELDTYVCYCGALAQTSSTRKFIERAIQLA